MHALTHSARESTIGRWRDQRSKYKCLDLKPCQRHFVWAVVLGNEFL